MRIEKTAYSKQAAEKFMMLRMMGPEEGRMQIALDNRNFGPASATPTPQQMAHKAGGDYYRMSAPYLKPGDLDIESRAEPIIDQLHAGAKSRGVSWDEIEDSFWQGYREAKGGGQPPA